jgi:two-component system response regulator (stage 0 sporulation protein F)
MAKILCVDDDLSLLALYQDELTEEGYEVVLAGSGQEALEKFSVESPDLVILDVLMPGMDGVDTLRALLEKDPRARVVLNTIYPEYEEKFRELGAVGCIIKSFDLTELREVTRRLVRPMGEE